MDNPAPTHRLSRWGWLLFPLLASAIFFQPIFKGEVLIPGDILGRVDDIWATETRPHNPLLSDVLLQFYPWQSYLFERLRNGEIPLWNPYVLTGTPFLANNQSAVFEPIRLIIFGLGTSAEDAFLPLAILRLALFGLFTWLFVRQRNIEQPIALAIGAVATIGMIPMIAWVSYPLAAVFLWFPLLLYATDRIMAGKKFGLLSLVAAMAAQLFSGNIQMSLFVTVIAAIYLFVMLRPWSWKRLGIWLVGMVLGTSIAAVQLLPSFEFIRQSTVAETGRSGYAAATINDFAKAKTWLGWTSLEDVRENLLNIVPAVFPFLHGNPAAANYRFPNQNIFNNFNELASSIGFIGFLLVVVGAVVAWRERIGKFFIVMTGICLGIVAHAPLFEVINYLPIINQTSTGRLRFFIAFGFLMLAAWGIREVIKQTEKARRTRFILLGSLIVYLAAVLKFAPEGQKRLDASLVIISVALIFIALRRIQNESVKVIVIGIAILGQPAVMMFGYNTSVPADSLYPTNRKVEMIREFTDINHRVIGLSGDGSRVPLMPNGVMGLGLYDPRGYEVVRLRRYDELTRDILLHSGSAITHIKGYTRLLDILGVNATLMNSADQDAGYNFMSQGNHTFAQEGDLVAYIPKDRIPERSFVTTAVTVAHTSAEAFEKTRTRAPYDIPIVEGKELPAATEPHSTSAPITHETANTLSLTTNTLTEGYLILSDAYDPAWRATIDGQPAEIIPANYAFRGVRVPAGEHIVRFEYRPRSFEIGKWISLSSLVVLLILFLSQRSRRE